MMRRSILFMPGNNAGMLLNADILGADGIILDLEDAVSPSEKDSARILVRNALNHLDYSKLEVIIRINGTDTPYWKKDLEEIIPSKPNMIMPPKINSVYEVNLIDSYITELEKKWNICENSIGLIPIIETALGVENAFIIANSSPRIKAILLGAEDLTADLRCKRTKKGDEIFFSRSRIVCAARAANIDCYDTPFTDIADDEGILEDAKFAKSLGFTGKAAISPRHIEVINTVFSPSKADIEYAIEVMQVIKEAEKQKKGVVALRGKMIDAPIVERTKQVLEMARELGVNIDE